MTPEQVLKKLDEWREKYRMSIQTGHWWYIGVCDVATDKRWGVKGCYEHIADAVAEVVAQMEEEGV